MRVREKNKEKAVMVETNIDDVSGEIIGFCFQKLMELGIKDVTVIPGFTKKNRPCSIIKVMCRKKDINRVCQVLFENTGVSGVRVYPFTCIKLKKEIKTVKRIIKRKEYKIRINIIKNSKGEIINVKPEYSDLVKIAKETGKSILWIRKKLFLSE